MQIFLKTLACSLSIVAVASTGTASAQEARTIGEIFRECGLGAIIFKGDTDNSELLAIVSNITSDLGSTAITSGLITPASCEGGSSQAVAFIMHTYPSLERDLARGEGEFINAMLDIRGCDVAVHSDMVADMRVSYSGESIGAGEFDRASALFNSLESTVSAGYAESCVI